LRCFKLSSRWIRREFEFELRHLYTVSLLRVKLRGWYFFLCLSLYFIFTVYFFLLLQYFLIFIFLSYIFQCLSFNQPFFFFYFSVSLFLCISMFFYLSIFFSPFPSFLVCDQLQAFVNTAMNLCTIKEGNAMMSRWQLFSVRYSD